jgi:hypothetical protein
MVACQFSDNSDKPLILNNYSPAHSDLASTAGFSLAQKPFLKPVLRPKGASSAAALQPLGESHKCLIVNKLHLNRFVNYFLVRAVAEIVFSTRLASVF